MNTASQPLDTSCEALTLVNEAGDTIGSAMRAVCHGNPLLLHAVVHCLLRNRQGAILLQRRGPHKDVQPGKWDTSVGGHVIAGESIEAALRRELSEEIGIEVGAAAPRFLYRYAHRNDYESEMVWTFLCESEGPFAVQNGEIDELRFWAPDEIEECLGSGAFTPNFEDEYRRYRQHMAAALSGF